MKVQIFLQLQSVLMSDQPQYTVMSSSNHSIVLLCDEIMLSSSVGDVSKINIFVIVVRCKRSTGNNIQSKQRTQYSVIHI